MRRTRPGRFCCALTAILASGTAAQPDPAPEPDGGARPRAAERIVKVFDFEERLSNPLKVPEGWIRAQHDPLVPRDRPSFPIWNSAALDYEVACRGEGSVRLPVAGGSTSLRLEAGVVPIFPMGEYAVRAVVRASGILHSRPRMAVRALDGHGNPIEGSERTVVLESAREEWSPLEVRLPGLFGEAAYLQVDLELVQPREFARATLGPHQVWEDDFDASVWFDDVVVVQMPQVSLATTSPLNVVTLPDAPVIAAAVRDLAAEDMTASIRLYDARRTMIDSTERAITSGRVSWEWSPRVAELGWYRAVIDVRAGGRLISSTFCDLAWLDAPHGLAPRYETGPSFSGAATDASRTAWRPATLELSELPPGEPGDIARATRSLGASWVSLPIWEASLRADDLPGRVDRLRDVIGAMRESWVEPAIGLPVVPDDLARALRVESDAVVRTFAEPTEAWEPFLLDAMDRLGNTAAHWQLGISGAVGAIDDPALADGMGAARAGLARLVPGLELGLGWRLDLPVSAAATAGADAARIELPAWMPTVPPEIAIGPWRDQSLVAPSFVLEPLASEFYTERAIAADLARRTVELWRVATDCPEPRFRAGIRDPWTIERGERPAAHPTVAAAAWRALADRLEGRVFGNDWPLSKGVRCVVFAPSPDAPERGGLIAAWSEDAAPEDAVLVATLARGPVQALDIFGNATVIEPVASEDGARLEHRIPLGPEPIFIEGINTGLVRFLTAIALDPPEIESITGEHEHSIVVRNPWDVPASGRIVVAEPGGYDPLTQSRDRTWDVSPRTLAFDVPAGAEQRLPLTVSFARSTEAGLKSFVFDIHVVADEDYGWIRARSYAELGWKDVWLDVTFRPAEPARDADLIVEATVTNTGERTRSFETVAFAPGMPRVRSSIGALEPGQSVVRRFPFPKAYDLVAGQRVVVSISEPDGPGRLTKSVQIPPR